ncbi:NAD(P)/FAD-dependent oxidoreductase [Sphingomonas sanxanigenens]|uniref:Pyridine nucleotide-disulfide oxidoreductase n=1 Tax=Sphingomonas sanxanigenens DSM 19645 = NX02 TaxID=1123269 RepID=W0A8V7_9SPHN|nr:FAD-dependent oxidoreductase [Sphingomonas sanxanigenens]AHE52778.1 pyridine nucleotide-disulfide oxidoreductase [Sphingomonas sanxanigenens DSM 19645 = NX02]
MADAADIVIVGGGAGGLELASRLGRRFGRNEGRQRVLLIDRSIFHLWKPSLHEVAAGSLDSHQEGLSYPVLARRNHFSFAFGDLIGLDPQARTIALGAIRNDDGAVLVPPRSLRFNTLVLAIGSGSNLFGTPGAAEHAYLLENVADAEAFNRRLTSAFLAAAYSDERTLRIAIVGAGATGVELSTELIEGHDELSAGLTEAQRFALDVTIVEAAPRILGGLPERVSDKAARALTAKGVRLLTDAKVAAVHADRLETSQGPVPAELIVWAAGVKAPDTNRDYGLETGRLNQFVVDDHLRTSVPGIHAMGDCAEAPGADGRPVPARAQAAAQQAQYLARALGRPERDPGPYVYRDRGSLVSLGGDRGVGSLMGGLAGANFLIEGLIAKWAYMALHLDHHRAIIGTRRTILLALSRLLHRRVSGRLKLH